MTVRYWWCQSVHPHACGEYEYFVTKSDISAVHPHACGEYRYLNQSALSCTRFTPTPVGNIHCRHCHAIGFPVHPHACGEYESLNPDDYVSPVHPHACGEYGVSSIQSIGRIRFTPTPVGNMLRSTTGSSTTTGSPPRLWGIWSLQRL